MSQTVNVTFFSLPFTTHRCTPNPVERAATWIDGTSRAMRMFPQIEPFIPEDTPAGTRVFFCPDCKLVGLAPGKKTL